MKKLSVSTGFLIIDSIQTVFHPDVTSAPAALLRSEKALINYEYRQGINIATFIVGHVTKDGQIAGPRLLEHMVDTVLYFEGQHHTYRILRAVKTVSGNE